jgi:hypothetical protein
MPLRADCPTCRKVFRVPDSLAGKKIKCTVCDNLLTLQPERSAATPSAPHPAPRAASPAPRPSVALKPPRSPATPSPVPNPSLQQSLPDKFPPLPSGILDKNQKTASTLCIVAAVANIALAVLAIIALSILQTRLPRLAGPEMRFIIFGLVGFLIAAATAYAFAARFVPSRNKFAIISAISFAALEIAFYAFVLCQSLASLLFEADPQAPSTTDTDTFVAAITAGLVALLAIMLFYLTRVLRAPAPSTNLKT